MTNLDKIISLNFASSLVSGVDKVVEGDLVLCKDDENDANGTAQQKTEALQEEESDIAEVIDGEGDDSSIVVAMDFLQKVKVKYYF